jgi:hypothetical protein
MKFYIFLILLIPFILSNSKHQPSKFDRSYRDCSNNDCKNRPYDDNCIFNCMDSKCYEKIYSNYLLEFGEINQELKNSFDKCFYGKN